MKSYEEVKESCNYNSSNLLKVVDDFLISYAASQNKIAERVDKLFLRYRSVISKLPSDWQSRAVYQYLAHSIFKKEGLIRVYMKHSALKRLTRDEMAFLEFQADHPWKFSFSKVLSNPAEDFYLMEDVFTEEEFLLYSPAVSSIMKTHKAVMWLALVSFNGSCCQAYGPIIPFNGFEPDDIYFFATELNHLIEDEEDLMSEIDRNPLPFMLLISGSSLPVLVSRNHRMLHVMAEHDVESLDTRKFSGRFRIAFSHDVFRLTLKRWGLHPHFAEAFYDEKGKILLMSAMTDRGYEELSAALSACGLDLPPEPDLRVCRTMVMTASDILGRKIDLLKYHNLFEEDIPKEKEEGLDKVNRLIQMALPAINSGMQPDIKSIAEKTGFDPKEAADIIRQVTEQINKIGRGKR